MEIKVKHLLSVIIRLNVRSKLNPHIVYIKGKMIWLNVMGKR